VFALLDDSDKFYQPSKGLELMSVCRNSGCLASLDCAVVDTLYLPEKSREADICNYCKVVHLSEDGRWQVNLSCAENLGIKTEKRFVLPAAQEYFYKKCHADYRALPPFHPNCESMSNESLDFIYPEHNAEIVIPRGFDGKFEEVVFSAVSKRADATLFWHMDNTYIGSTKDDHKISLTPEKGSHVLSVVDEIGNQRAVMIHLK
jgi:penicillin-binding protein 1C